MLILTSLKYHPNFDGLPDSGGLERMEPEKLLEDYFSNLWEQWDCSEEEIDIRHM